MLVVRKPAGLAAQTAKIGQPDVVSELKNYLRQPYLGVIHRLDQPVEGLLVFAKNKNAAAGLTSQLQKQGEGGFLHKHYYAVLCGKPAEKECRFVDYMYKDRENRAVVLDHKEGGADSAKQAILCCRILQVLDSPAQLALADIVIETGRFHQIRAQMAYHGLPLLGDARYGDAAAQKQAQELGVKNVALCAYGLEFRHPVSGKRLQFSVEPQGVAFSFFRI